MQLSAGLVLHLSPEGGSAPSVFPAPGQGQQALVSALVSAPWYRLWYQLWYQLPGISSGIGSLVPSLVSARWGTSLQFPRHSGNI